MPPAEPGASLPCLFVTTQSKGQNEHTKSVVVHRSACAKKAETLALNIQRLVARHGLSRVGFVTLTFADNVQDRVEAQRRWNSLCSNRLRDLLPEWCVGVHRQRRGAIHYHLVAAFPFDIRSGFDFAACGSAVASKLSGDLEGFRRWERVYTASANKRLRKWWFDLSCILPLYGFGRAETLPIRSTSEALARYVGAYVTSHGLHRDGRDRGLRSVRYKMVERAAYQNFSWVNGRAAVFRKGCALYGRILGLNYEQLREKQGKRWAYAARRTINTLAEHQEAAMEFVERIPVGADYLSRVRFTVALTQHLENAHRGKLSASRVAAGEEASSNGG